MQKTTAYGLGAAALGLGIVFLHAMQSGMDWQAALGAVLSAAVGMLGFHAADGK